MLKVNGKIALHCGRRYRLWPPERTEIAVVGEGMSYRRYRLLCKSTYVGFYLYTAGSNRSGWTTRLSGKHLNNTVLISSHVSLIVKQIPSFLLLRIESAVTL